MPLQLPVEAEKWQTVYTRDDAHADSGKYAASSALSLFVGTALGTIYLSVFILNLTLIAALPFYIKAGLIPLMAIGLLFVFLKTQSAGTKFASEFMLAFHQPPETVKSEDIIKNRLYGKTKLPPPFNILSQFAYILVRDGEIVKSGEWPAWSALHLGGPIMLIVFDGNALYLERGNQFSRVVGPGEKVPFLEWYETIKYVVDLRPQIKEGSQAVWTKDGINIKLTMKIESRIGDPKQTQPGSNLVYPFDAVAVRKAIERYAVRWPECPQGEPSEFTWLDAVWGQVTGIVPGYIGSRMLDDLFIADRNGGQILSPSAIQEISEKLNKETQKFGVYVTDFQVEKIDIPPEADNALRELWKAEKQGLITEDEGRTAAFQIRSQEATRAKAQHDLINNIANELEKNKDGNFAEPLLLSFSRILDESLSEPLMRAYLAKETLETLEKIQDMLKNEP